MTYVPVVPSPPTPPSPRTRELAGLLTKVLEEYKKTHPALTQSEIKAAFRLAGLATRSSSSAAPLVLSLGLGILVAGLFAGLLFFRSAGGTEMGSEVPMIIVALIVFIAILMFAVKVRSG